MASFEPDRLLLVLAERGVDFLVIGGIAATLHGSRQMTDDVDVLFERSRENRERLAMALAALDAHLFTPPSVPPPLARRRPWDEDTPGTGGRLTAEYLGLWNSYHFVTPYGDFDCMVTVPGAPAYPEARERAGEAPLEGYTIRVVDIDDLIAMKRATARPKDLATVDELLELRKLIEQERAHGEGDDQELPPAADLAQ